MKKRQVQAMIAGMTAMLALAVPTTTVWAAVPTTEKEQTVYVNADANGNTEKVIVSNWLKNIEKDASIIDKSELNDIENVKGEETFSKNSDGSLTWNADGNDIYYQGETTKELPVSVKMTYYLDGKEISASELAGKSGKVKIRIDYVNKYAEKAKVGGKEEEINTPFMMVTGMILPTDKFTNIQVENGKVISDGNSDIVVGMGFPGLQESLKLSEIKGMEDKKIPDYVEITADVKDFSLAMTATVATTGTLKELGFDDIDGVDELEEKLDLLSDSSASLAEGSKALKDGVEQLNSSADVFADGLNTADKGAGQLKNGIDTMNGKKGELLNGINQFADGVKMLDSGAYQLQEGISSYTQNAAKLSAGIGELYAKLYGSTEIFQTLPGKMQELNAGIGKLADGAEKFQGGALLVKDAAGKIDGQLQTLQGGLSTAQNCVSLALNNINNIEGNANAVQRANVEAALNAAGLDDAQKEAVLSNLKDISLDTSALNQAKGGLSQVQAAMGNTSIDTKAIEQLSAGADEAAAGAKDMQAGLQGMQAKLAGMANIQAAMEELMKGVGELKAGSEQLCGYNDTLNAGAKQLTAGTKGLLAGGSKLQQGAGTLSNGIGELAKGAKELKGGTKKLADGSKELKAGTAKLAAGSTELANGMQKFDEEGIQKLTDMLTGETKNILDRLKAVVDADKAYTAFDGKDKDAKGSVKFIIETAGIE